jgi:hypothetical protein
MVKTSMTEIVGGSFRYRKRRLRSPETAQPIGTIEVVTRDANNPVKRRAEARARQLGKTLGQVYQEARVNRQYLTEMPKNGWAESKLEAIAKALNWEVRDLRHGPDGEVEPTQEKPELLEMSINMAVRLLSRRGPIDPASPKIGQLSRLVYESLMEHMRQGEELPSASSLRIWTRALMAAWVAASARK